MGSLSWTSVYSWQCLKQCWFSQLVFVVKSCAPGTHEQDSILDLEVNERLTTNLEGLGSPQWLALVLQEGGQPPSCV